MKRDSFTIPLLPDELIIDNFAGGGGTSTGLEQAFGRPVDVAINHDPKALAMHRANHPHTRHLCESVWDVNPRSIEGPVALVWLSPDCKHFSKAKGGKPVEKRIRGLAWVALRWAAVKRPRVIMLENVEEFRTWGPLVVQPDGSMRPCPKRRGREFGAFVNALRRQGYSVEWRELRACDYGAPTIRKRFFLIARSDGLPIVWPTPTHGAPICAEVVAGRRLPWRTAAECIDWSLPCHSIFLSADEGRAVGVRRPLAVATMRRIARGVMRYVVNADDPFIVPTGDGLVASTLIQTGYGERPGQSPRALDIHRPIGTVVSSGKHALVTSFLAKHYGGNETDGQPMTAPMSTITTQDHHAEVRAFLVKYYGNERDGVSLHEPMHTIPTRDRFGLVTVRGEQYAIADIGMRMLMPRELFIAQGFPPGYVIEWGIDEGGQRIALTKTEQGRMCGNSVSPALSRALVEANFTHEQAWRVQA